jgi:hypothetical protein
MNDIVQHFTSAGLHLVPIPAINGKPTKAPIAKGWNKARSPENPDGYTNDHDHLTSLAPCNYGLYHGESGTLALDLDDLDRCNTLFEDAGAPLLAWLEGTNRLEIKSPKKNRGKLIFKLPANFGHSVLRQYKHNGAVIFELRCGNCQDVVIGQHPEGGNYEVIGNPAAIPQCPEILLDMLANWGAWKSCFDSSLDIEQEPPKYQTHKPQQGENLKGYRNPIKEFNQSEGVESVLIRNIYQKVSKDRFIRPGSESKAPGAVIMRNCADGVERVYSHGGDALNDGYAHDAFDCYRLLECGGDFNKALAWNAEITKNNQRLFMGQQAKAEPFTGNNLEDEKESKEKLPFTFVPANELTAYPKPQDWLIDKIIERGSLNLFWGEPGAGKTLFATDWGFCIALGQDWHHHKTQETNVVVIAGEGHAGMGRRLKALELKYNVKAPETLFISQRPAQLQDSTNAAWVAESIKAICPNPGLVIIDTLHRNMGGDENASQDIGKFINNLDIHFKPLGVAVLVVHHSGHSDKQRSRGSSSIRAAMDGEFAAVKDDDGITLSCHKAKDFEAFKPMRFTLKQAELDWFDDEGEPLTSVYVDYSGEAKAGTKKPKLSARDEAVLNSLFWATKEHGIQPTAEIKAKFGGFDTLASKYKQIVHIDHWREQAYKAIVVDANTDDAKRKAFKRCRDKLLNLAKTVEYDGYVWRIYD